MDSGNDNGNRQIFTSRSKSFEVDGADLSLLHHHKQKWGLLLWEDISCV